MPKPEDLIGRPVSRLQELTRTYAEERVRTLSKDEVVEALEAQGIDSLDSLVDKALEAARAGLHTGGQVAKDAFLFTQFIYRTEGPGLSDDIVNEVATKVQRMR